MSLKCQQAENMYDVTEGTSALACVNNLCIVHAACMCRANAAEFHPIVRTVGQYRSSGWQYRVVD